MKNAAAFRRIKTICQLQPDTQAEEVLGFRTLTTLESVEDSNNLPNNPFITQQFALTKKVLLTLDLRRL